jgi:hypothetical protein
MKHKWLDFKLWWRRHGMRTRMLGVAGAIGMVAVYPTLGPLYRLGVHVGLVLIVVISAVVVGRIWWRRRSGNVR